MTERLLYVQMHVWIMLLCLNMYHTHTYMRWKNQNWYRGRWKIVGNVIKFTDPNFLPWQCLMQKRVPPDGMISNQLGASECQLRSNQMAWAEDWSILPNEHLSMSIRKFGEFVEHVSAQVVRMLYLHWWIARGREMHWLLFAAPRAKVISGARM